MTELKQIYKCEVCGNIIEVLHTGFGELVCCGKPMELQAEKTKDEGQEKHLPVIEKIENGVKVSIGSAVHPMEGEHFIEWIELTSEQGSVRKFLNAGNKPVAEFSIEEGELSARAYCNVHGLWESE